MSSGFALRFGLTSPLYTWLIHQGTRYVENLRKLYNTISQYKTRKTRFGFWFSSSSVLLLQLSLLIYSLISLFLLVSGVSILICVDSALLNLFFDDLGSMTLFGMCHLILSICFWLIYWLGIMLSFIILRLLLNISFLISIASLLAWITLSLLPVSVWLKLDLIFYKEEYQWLWM